MHTIKNKQILRAESGIVGSDAQERHRTVISSEIFFYLARGEKKEKENYVTLEKW